MQVEEVGAIHELIRSFFIHTGLLLIKSLIYLPHWYFDFLTPL